MIDINYLIYRDTILYIYSSITGDIEKSIRSNSETINKIYSL